MCHFAGHSQGGTCPCLWRILKHCLKHAGCIAQDSGMRNAPKWPCSRASWTLAVACKLIQCCSLWLAGRQAQTRQNRHTGYWSRRCPARRRKPSPELEYTQHKAAWAIAWWRRHQLEAAVLEIQDCTLYSNAGMRPFRRRAWLNSLAQYSLWHWQVDRHIGHEGCSQQELCSWLCRHGTSP